MRIGPNMKAMLGVALILAAAWIAYENRDSFFPHETHPGPDPFPPGQRDFIRAVATGEIEEVRRLLTADPSLAKLEGPWGSPVHVAVGRDLPEMTALLLDHGGSLTARGRWDGTPLHWAAWCGAERACEVLLDRGADVEARGDMFSSTPLLWAANGSANAGSMAWRGPPPTADWVGVCRLLIARGAKADTANAEGTPASFMAAEDVVEVLVEHGAKRPPPRPKEPAPPPEGDEDPAPRPPPGSMTRAS